MKLSYALAVSILALLLAGCSSQDTTGVVSEPPQVDAAQTSTTQTLAQTTEVATASATVQSTEAINPTNTPPPTVTITPTTAFTAPFTGPLDEAGPWIVFSMPGGLFATNPDGTGLTRLSEDPIDVFAVQPDSSGSSARLVAYVTFTDVTAYLKILRLPDGEVFTVSNLVPLDYGDLRHSLFASMSYGGLNWSPDGRYLAFIGALDGPSADVYQYDVRNDIIMRLTSGTAHAYGLLWSPDGRYIVHQGFDVMGMGGPSPTGIWSVNTDSGEVFTLFEPASPESQYVGDVEWRGWKNQTELQFSQRRGVSGLRIGSVNVASGAASYVDYDNGLDAAYSPQHDTWLHLTNSDQADELQALHLFQNGDMQEIAAGRFYTVDWFEEAGIFLAQGYDLLLMVAPEGNAEPIDLPEPSGELGIAPSPDGTLWAWHKFDSMGGATPVFIGAPRSTPEIVIFPPTERWVHAVRWSPDSQYLFVFAERGVWIAERPDFVPRQIAAWQED